ncbi:hypothetical protein PCE1_003475 [Barthelona sp. PCE]
MGQKSSKLTTTSDLEQFAADQEMHLDDVKLLFDAFQRARAENDDDYITEEQFKSVLNFSNDLLAHRMFVVFDHDNNGSIDFREFIKGLSVFSSGSTLSEKIAFSFSLYDFDGDKCIDQDELFTVLNATLQASQIELPTDVLREIVASTFAKVDSDNNGVIDVEEYTRLVQENPTILDGLSLSNGLSSLLKHEDAEE